MRAAAGVAGRPVIAAHRIGGLARTLGRVERLLIVVASFALMEPVTAGVHRWVMHGFGWGLHRSHHRPRPGLLERNDLFPVMFASVTMLAMAVGFRWWGRDLLVPASVGVTGYGVTYAFVHDVYIHQRVRFGPRVAFLERRKSAHLMHHTRGEAPYGMLFPVVPARVRTGASEWSTHVDRAPAADAGA